MTTYRQIAEAAARTANMKDWSHTHRYRKPHDAHVKEWLRQPVTRVNLMSGKTYQEARGTPNYCSPASEAYWSM